MRKAFDFIKSYFAGILLALMIMACQSSPVSKKIGSGDGYQMSITDHDGAIDPKTSNKIDMKFIWNRYPDLFMGIDVTYLDGEAQVTETRNKQIITLSQEEKENTWKLTILKSEDGKIVKIQEELNGKVKELSFSYSGRKGEGRDSSGKLHRIEYDENGNLTTWEKLDDSSPSKDFSISFFKNEFDKLGRLSRQVRYESDGMQNPIYYSLMTYESDGLEWSLRQVKKQTVLIDVDVWENMKLPLEALRFPAEFEKMAITFKESRIVVD